jgi:glycosyltransferase involved in cell wall biosynthesis
MKRVLFLAYLFPPIANSGTQRPLKFAKYLRDYGWQPTVLTAASFNGHPTDPSLLADIPAGVDVVRVPMISDQIGAAATALLGGTSLGRRIGEGLRWRMQRRFRTPDIYACWRPNAMRAAMRVFRNTGFDAIYATGYPWTSLLVGRDVAKATARPFIADFRDLWVGETLFREDHLPREQEMAFERSIIDTARHVVTVSTGMTRWLTAAYPEMGEQKFVTIHNGFDPADIDVPAAEVRPDRPFRIVYTGVWKEGYNPSELYDSIDWIRRSRPHLLDNVEVVAAGFTPGHAERRGLTKYIKEVGFVPHNEAVALMRSADIQFLSYVDPDRQWAVPAKLYEYLAIGAPVLALTQLGKETAQIVAKVGGGVAVSPNDPGALLEVLSEAFRVRRLVVPERNIESLDAFNRRQLTARLAGLLDGAVSRAQIHTALRIDAGSSRVLATRSS